ncbi:MAG: hypothetical protein ACYSUV_00050 [Planctomycetota bacterium]|jgi:hypothetical protein
MTIEVLVIACRKRPALITPYLEEGKIPHRVHWTTDYELPEGWTINPDYGSFLRHQKQYVGHLRCWGGHQDALKTMGADVALVLEDDAVPNRPDWPAVIAAATKMMGQTDLEVVSVHGRAFHPEQFEITPLEFPAQPDSDLKVYVPKADGKRVWVQGSLAYLIRKDAAPKLIAKEFDGYPIDIFLCNEFKFALADPSPFNHDRSHPSLID